MQYIVVIQLLVYIATRANYDLFIFCTGEKGVPKSHRRQLVLPTVSPTLLILNIPTAIWAIMYV